MEKSIKLIATLLLLAVVLVSNAQNSGVELFIGGQYSNPHSFTRDKDFSATDGSGLYAKPGGGFSFEINSRKLFGFGGLFAYSGFGADYRALATQLKAEYVQNSGIIGSTQFGFGPLANLPIMNEKVFLQLKSYVGFRFIGTPNFSAHYSPLVSRFTTVQYITYSRASTFYQFGGAFQFFPSSKFGLSFGAEYLGGTVSTINYRYETIGSKVVSGFDSINQSVHYYSFKIGLLLLL